MKRPVEVKILGQTFTVASEEDVEHVRRSAQLVDEKMQEVSSAKGAVTTVHVAILAALNLASEYQKLKDERAALQRSLDALASQVDSSLDDSKDD